MVKSRIKYSICHNYATISVNSYDYFSLEGMLTFHNVIINIKPVWNKYQNHYFYSTFLEKCSYQLPKNNDNKL